MNRLDQRVARWAGLSRKEAAQAVRRGRVTVDGVVVRQPGLRIDGALALDGRPLLPPPWLAIFHKPAGVQSTVGDDWGRRSLAEAAGPLLAWGLHPVGRLDAETTGLLPFAADGALTQRLLHPRHAVSKTYQATVEGEPGPALREALLSGVQTASGVHRAHQVHIEGARITLTVTEGKHRMVRRMLANAGFPVVALHRSSLGALSLGALPEGQWRPASAEELSWARALL